MNRFNLILKIIFNKRFGWWLCGQVDREWEEQKNLFNNLNPKKPLT